MLFYYTKSSCWGNPHTIDYMFYIVSTLFYIFFKYIISLFTGLQLCLFCLRQSKITAVVKCVFLRLIRGDSRRRDSLDIGHQREVTCGHCICLYLRVRVCMLVLVHVCLCKGRASTMTARVTLCDYTYENRRVLECMLHWVKEIPAASYSLIE